jgi:hypothetical protein
MKQLIATGIFCAALLAGLSAGAQEAADAAATAAAQTEPAAAPTDGKKGLHVQIDLDADEKGGKALVDIDTAPGTDEDDGPVGRVIRKGVADVLEEHVLTNAELSDEEREEVRQAIAELRGTTEGAGAEAAADSSEAQGQGSVPEAGKDTPPRAKKAKTRRSFIVDGDEDNVPSWVGFVASLAIVFTLGLPIMIVALILWFGYRKRRLAHDTINGYLASGKEIPPEIMHNLFRDAGPVAATPRTNLHKGTVNSAIGLVMVVGFNMIDAEFLAAIGFIFLFVGLAQLLIWKLEQGKKNEVDSAQG